MSNSEDKLEVAGNAPRRASNDAGTIEQHSLQEQIELDRYLNSKKASKKRGLGVRIGNVIPPGGA